MSKYTDYIFETYIDSSSTFSPEIWTEILDKDIIRQIQSNHIIINI